MIHGQRDINADRDIDGRDDVGRSSIDGLLADAGGLSGGNDALVSARAVRAGRT
jgi:hypothetical protein